MRKTGAAAYRGEHVQQTLMEHARVIQVLLTSPGQGAGTEIAAHICDVPPCVH